MNFEQKLKNIMDVSDLIKDKSAFLNDLHGKREYKIWRKGRIMSSLVMSLLIISLGVVTFTQDPQSLPSDHVHHTNWEEDAENDDYILDLSVLLVDMSDDIWGTIEYLDETSMGIVNQTQENN